MENPSSLGLIKGIRSRDVLADVLREQILGGTRLTGVALPAERELVAETGLSRASVRDALRILESEGLIQTKQGRYGGSMVRQPADDALAKPIALFVRGRKVSVREMVEARVVFEPTIAEFAALRRTDDELEALTAVTLELEQAIGDIPRFLEVNVRWYLSLADACHNDLLRAFVSSIAGLILEESGKEGLTPEPTRRVILKSHQRVLEAVKNKDALAAGRRMTRHVSGYAEHFNKN
jgi:GntR family transcriptional regulator, transcriptional repressor for pyruvate dehydrogenase complex